MKLLRFKINAIHIFLFVSALIIGFGLKSRNVYAEQCTIGKLTLDVGKYFNHLIVTSDDIDNNDLNDKIDGTIEALYPETASYAVFHYNGNTLAIAQVTDKTVKNASQYSDKDFLHLMIGTSPIFQDAYTTTINNLKFAHAKLSSDKKSYETYITSLDGEYYSILISRKGKLREKDSVNLFNMVSTFSFDSEAASKSRPLKISKSSGIKTFFNNPTVPTSCGIIAAYIIIFTVKYAIKRKSKRKKEMNSDMGFDN